MTGHQKVSDLLTNHKVDHRHRNKAMVLKTSSDDVAAVIFPPGHVSPKGVRTGMGVVSHDFRVQGEIAGTEVLRVSARADWEEAFNRIYEERQP